MEAARPRAPPPLMAPKLPPLPPDAPRVVPLPCAGARKDCCGGRAAYAPLAGSARVEEEAALELPREVSSLEKLSRCV
jgi:hypothetical protein